MEISIHAAMYCTYLLVAVITGVASVQLTIQPRQAVVRPGDSISVVCKVPAGTVLKSCWIYISGMPGIDLSNGRRSEATGEYAYYGRGLERGQCGINLLRVAHDCSGSSKLRTVTCAVEVEAKGWFTAYMALLVTNKATFPLNAEQPKIDIKPGANVTILCQSSGVSLKTCTFYGKNLGTIDLHRGPNNPPLGAMGAAVGHVHYFGHGLEEGDCGMMLTDVREEWNGLVWCLAKSQHDNWGYDLTTLMVAKPPSTVNLAVSSNDVNLDSTLNATCTVRDSRPAATLHWDSPFDEGVTNVLSNDIIDAKLDFEARTVAQVMRKRVTETDHLKNVRCAARFDNSKQEVLAQQRVKVRFCGKRNAKNARPLIAGGEVAKNKEFPWHIALYRKMDNKHIYICGGSIISTKHVISAAHCFWNHTFTRAGLASSYAAAAGKIHRLWEEDDDAQRFDVAELHVEPRYNHQKRHYEDDIAILKLNGELDFSQNVQPICLDWRMKYESSLLVSGNIGISPGWGLTEESNLSDNLRYAEIPFMDLPQCRLVIPRAFEEFLAPGKFCAGFVNQSTSVCKGDSGGGLVFKPNTTSPTQSYYLLGIVSVAPTASTGRCNAEQVSAFTMVSTYYTWIKEVLDDDDMNHVKDTNL